MSLLEDVFLHDEANEAQELERVIEGDDYDERRRSISDDDSDNGNRDDEAEEDKRRVDPASTKTKKVAKNPRFILNPARLTGPRGIQVIPEHFKDFKFKGKGHEKDDLDLVLKKLEHWAYRLYPKFVFQDCLKKIETLGKKRPVMVHLHKIRTDQFLSEDTVVQKDSSDDEAQPPQEEDEFDKLLRQQIELARTTPAPGSTRKKMGNDNWSRVIETPIRDDRSAVIMPKATSSPSISEEQKERMLRNRKLAEEKRLARLKQAAYMDNSNNTIVEVEEINKSQTNNVIVDVNSKELDNFEEIAKEIVSKKINKSNVIESSDSEDEHSVMTVNQSIVVDIHKTNVDKNVVNDEEICNKIDNVESVNVDGDISKSKEFESVCTMQNNEDNIYINDGNENDVAKVSNEMVPVAEDEKTYNVKSTDINTNYIDEKCEPNSNTDKVENEILIDTEITENKSDNIEERLTPQRTLQKETVEEVIDDKCEPNSNSDKVENEILVDMEIPEDKSNRSINLEENLTPQSTLQKETAEDIVEDVMDVDFSDDF